MSKAAELAALIGSQTALSNRNLIINGAMQVAQRGTSETSVSTSQYANACDRFKVNGNNGTWTISQDTNAPSGFSNSFKMLLTATETIGGTSYWSVEHKMEGQNLQQLSYGTSDAETVTVSFYVKSNITGTYCLNLYQDDGSKNFPKTYTIDSANTWERKTISFVGDTSTALDNDNASSLRTQFFVVAGSSYNSGSAGSRVAYSDATFAAGQSAQVDAVNDYWQITGLQLEIGDVATPFEHRSYGDELAACQRYYQKSYPDSVSAGSVSQLGAHMVYIPATGNTFRYTLVFEDQMRANPTATFYVPETGTSGFGGYEASGDTNKESISATFLNNKSYLLYNTGMGYVGSFYWQYQLDAEL